MEAGWDGKASRLHYARYPSLALVLLGLLKTGRAMIHELTTIAAAEAVFPALDIVRRAGPPAALRVELQMYIADYLASPAWHVREIAARTLCSCLLHSKWLGSLRSLLVRKETSGSSEKNRFHGALLTGKFLVERLAEVMPEELTGTYSNIMKPLSTLSLIILIANFRGLVSLLKELRTSWPATSSCPDVYAADVELVNQAAKYGLSLARQGDDAADLMLKDLLMSPAEIDEMGDAGQHGALLRLQLAVHAVYGLYQEENIDIFLQKCRGMINVNVSSLVATLEALPEIWPAEHLSESTTCQLFDLYRDVCTYSSEPEPRALALRNLTDLMVDVRGREVLAPSRASLEELWARLQEGSLSPSFSDEIVRAAGAILGYLLSAEARGDFDSASALRSFGALIAESSTDDKVSYPTPSLGGSPTDHYSPSTHATRPPNPSSTPSDLHLRSRKPTFPSTRPSTPSSTTTTRTSASSPPRHHPPTRRSHSRSPKPSSPRSHPSKAASWLRRQPAD